MHLNFPAQAAETCLRAKCTNLDSKDKDSQGCPAKSDAHNTTRRYAPMQNSNKKNGQPRQTTKPQNTNKSRTPCLGSLPGKRERARPLTTKQPPGTTPRPQVQISSRCSTREEKNASPPNAQEDSAQREPPEEKNNETDCNKASKDSGRQSPNPVLAVEKIA